MFELNFHTNNKHLLVNLKININLLNKHLYSNSTVRMLALDSFLNYIFLMISKSL
jgi:hypothetical protein